VNLSDSLYIASSGLANINRGLAVVAQNVSNAGDPNYVEEVSPQTSATAGGIGMGVRTAPTVRALDAALQTAAFAQQSTASSLATTTASLQQIDAVQGTPGAGTDLGSLLGKLQDTFSTLATDPSSQAQQNAVIGAAATLAQQINALAGAYQTQQQGAQDGIVADVTTANQTLATIGGLNQQIIALKSAGESTADLENQRDASVSALGKLLDVRAIPQSNGAIQLVTTGGLTLPTQFTTPPLAVASATLGAGAYYPGGGIPPVTLGGVDVTQQITGGSIGANVTLRDTTLPTYRAGLDEFSESLSFRFEQQGLQLFSDSTGSIPFTASPPPVQGGYLGYSSTIQVDPGVTANPNAVRDGTGAIAGSPTGPSAFTPNPPGGPAGFTTLIQRVLTYALGSEAQAGVPQQAPNVAGLGASGTLSLPFTAPATLGDFATNLVSSQAQDSAQATSEQSTANAVLTSLQAQNAATNGVSVDTEMSTMIQLQNAYAANARVMSGVQTMWNALLQAVQ
jgi:flagellar hook-associated protein 1 FlgK